MMHISFELDGNKVTFEAALNYSMIAVRDGVAVVPCRNYNEVISYGKKHGTSLRVIPCKSKGKANYNCEVEEYNPETHKDYIWEAPKQVERQPVEPVVKSNKKTKKLRQRRSKK